MNNILEFITTISRDKSFEGEKIEFFNLNPDDYKQFLKECDELNYTIIDSPKDHIQWKIIKIDGNDILIDCRGWEYKYGSWWFDNDVNIMINDQTEKKNTYYYWKDIMFHSIKNK